MILDYVLQFHLQECITILSDKDILGYYSLKIDFLKLFETYPDVGDKVLCNPIHSLPKCNGDILKAQQNILEKPEYKDEVQKQGFVCLKRNIHARFFGLPVCPELHRTVFPKNVDLGCFLKVSGTVVRVTQAKMLEYQRKYVCMKCKYENIVAAKFEHRYVLKAPNKCSNEDARCKCSTFSQVNMVSREYCKDYQEIKIQEQVNTLNIGTIPGSMWVVIENDLVDCCKPGDDVNICGTVRRRWRPTVQNKKSEVELVLQANYVEVSNSQRSEVIAAAPDIKEHFDEFWDKYKNCPLKGRDQILAAVCQQVYGLHLVKLAVLLTVITGSNHIVEKEAEKKVHDDKHTARVRGQCHLLLVGDPGTGKSQLLRAGATLCSRSVFTSGAGSTRAGLTCCALREEGEWQLEAGALVLSDGGVCCIDEISQLREHDRAAIHEATEQQTISIAKAGIVCKLNTRCAIIAACNPKGHYDVDQPLAANVSLGTPLLSRFDLIFIMLDSKNKTWDKKVSSYILFGESCLTNAKNLWSLEKLQTYIGLVGPRYSKMTKSANIILQSYYMLQRKSEHRDASRTTVRMLDSLVRLSQAHCRLMYRTTILPMDAIFAVSLVDLSMQDCTLPDTADALHSTFQKYPDFEYLCTAKKLLSKLNLHEIWQDELLYYAKLLEIDHKTLECDINNGKSQMFAKYDNVADDSMPLSAIITSSYFNDKKGNDPKQLGLGFIDDVLIKTIHDDKRVVTDKLATTLKKHATLNKVDGKLSINAKTAKKRKRREVTVDTGNLSRTKKTKTKISKIINFESESDFEDDPSILNVVPSVNDVFTDLGIDFKFDNIENHAEIDDQIKTIVKETKTSNTDQESNLKHNFDKTKSLDESSIKSKLNKFMFVEKSDKLIENKQTNEHFSITDKVIKIENKSISSSSSAPVHNSQMSIFETDSDVDLDI